MNKKCKYCGKEFETKSHRAKYCCDAHKMAARRGTPKNISPPSKKEPSKIKNTVNEAFEAHYPDYYVLQKEPHTSKCYICKQEFTSNMRLLKFCSPDHQQLFLKTVTDQYKPHSLGDVK